MNDEIKIAIREFALELIDKLFDYMYEIKHYDLDVGVIINELLKEYGIEL